MSTEQRVARVLAKMTPGTMGGESRVATPVTLRSTTRLPVNPDPEQTAP